MQRGLVNGTACNNKVVQEIGSIVGGGARKNLKTMENAVGIVTLGCRLLDHNF